MASGLRFTFTVPTSVRLFDTDPKSVTLVPLTVAQEIEGNKIFERTGSGYQKMAMAITAVDGKPANWVDGGVDKMLDACSPAVRGLILSAFLKIHMPEEGVKDAFLASMTTEV